MLDIFDHFVDQRVREVPVGDPLKQEAVLLRESFLPKEIRGAYQAWSFLDAALESEDDRAILKRCRPPREVVKFVGKWFDLKIEVATLHLFDKFHVFLVSQNSNPIAALHALEATNNQKTKRVWDGSLTLPAKNDHAKKTLQSIKILGEGRDHPRAQHAIL